MARHAHLRRVRIGLGVALVLVLSGVVIDSLLSARWAFDDALLLLAAAAITLALVATRNNA
jgi:hypothetical protein